MRRLLPLLVAVLLHSTAAVPGRAQTGASQPDEQQARRQLEQLQRDIKRINREISSASERKDSLQQQLQEAEVELGATQRQIDENERGIAATRRELTGLEQRRGDLQQARQTQGERIAAELKTAWQLSRQGQIKVLLSQENPHTIARAMGYYRYFFTARNRLLQQYRETLQQLRKLEQRIADTLAQLQARQSALQHQRASLVQAQHKREQAVAQLSASIDSKNAQLRQKQLDRKELEQLLRAIEEAVVNMQLPDNYQAFKSARGKMPWPVAGKASNRFGRARNEGKMRWQGLTIPAAQGATVRAIHHGRVVYADWLRGSGLLLIIDHGDGYMSLYAHNQSLLRDVGEWVSAGTPVSTVGNSGGQERWALYFEIRHHGKPVDPAIWCKG
ncbi:MAG: peptidoglycan DD-metalloendopeptidase family protein [Halioglobus sp.]|nr:peptidoglycan DD-metalloendopeptidase family protein [Halioglobus sp.]